MKKPHGLKGRKKSPEHRAKLAAILARVNKRFKKGFDERRFASKHSEETRRLFSEQRKGKTKRGQGPNGEHITPIHTAIRQSAQYLEWRNSVFQRDCYTCQICKRRSGRGVVIHADHIQPFSTFPELRFELTNGRTLCVDCHRKTETWGRRKNQTVVSRPGDNKESSLCKSLT